MLSSTRRGISYWNPDRSDRPDVADIVHIIDALELDLVYYQGTASARGALSGADLYEGIFWHETDTGKNWLYDGSTWRVLGPVRLAGSVDTDGSILAGSGFTVARTAQGNYTVTFNTAFATAPVVTLTSAGAQLRHIQLTEQPTTAHFKLSTVNVDDQTAVDTAFHFRVEDKS